MPTGFWVGAPSGSRTETSVNNLNATLLQYGTAANRPAAATTNTGMSYYATDTGVMSRSNGTGWDETQPLADPAAATAGLRSLSTTSTTAAAGDHGH